MQDLARLYANDAYLARSYKIAIDIRLGCFAKLRIPKLEGQM